MDQVKISVLSSGQALLDGREVTLSELEEALQAARLNGSPIRYYREDPESEAPAEAEAVLFPDRSPRPIERDRVARHRDLFRERPQAGGQ